MTGNILSTANHARYSGDGRGFYESFFVRANHPDRPQAFWIRYTLFEPSGRPADAVGELWSTYFDGATGRHVCLKAEVPISQCRFDPAGFHVAIGAARLDAGYAAGGIMDTDSMEWGLSVAGSSPPLLLFPEKLYSTRLPKAKTLVGRPHARFNGTLTVNNNTIAIDEWMGSQNHNWGVKHTDVYAWGQVAGFDDAPQSFLEVATAQLKFGPVKTPRMTVIVLRHEGREYAFNTIVQSLRAFGRFEYFRWNFSSESAEACIEGVIQAEPEDFVGLAYHNPPGGIKHCLNTKIASCQVSLMTKADKQYIELTTLSRAAFEILTDDHTGHGIRISA